jgi:hypothetical protein
MGQRKRQRAQRLKRLLARLDGRSPADLIRWDKCRGDAAETLANLRRLGAAYRPAAEIWERWTSASLRDLGTLRRGIRSDWDIAPGMKAALLAAIMAKWEGASEEELIAVANTVVAMDMSNLRNEYPR